MKLQEMLSRSSTSDSMKPRKHTPWISGPIDRKAAKVHHGPHEETKMNSEQNVIEFDESRLHHTDSDAPMFKHHHEATSIELFYDLFFVANLATFTANHEVDTRETLASYVGFLTLMWFTWLQTSLFDVRFSSDSYFHRVFKLISFGVFTGFAIVGPIFDTGKEAQDVKAFKAMSLILMISRLALIVQYGVVLWYVRGYKKVFMPLLLHCGTLFVSAMVLLGLAFSFKYDKDQNGDFVYKDDGTKTTAASNAFVGWYVIVILEAVAVVTISSLWRVVSFKHTHLVERVGLLTLIVMGEGIIGMTKSVTYVARYSVYTSSATIGVVVAAVCMIYCLWVLYFDQIEHDRFGTIRQQIWTLLHFPFHIAIVLTVEGSTQFISWWIAAENLAYLQKNLAIDTQFNTNDTAAFVNGVNITLQYFDNGFKKAFIPDYSSNLTAIQHLDINKSQDVYQINLIVNDIYDSLTVWLFKIFGVKLSDGLTKNAKDNYAKASAVGEAFSTVFVFFLISAGCVLIILGIMYWFGKTHKSRGEMASVFVRIFAGVGLALVSTSIYTAAGPKLIFSPWMIPLVLIVFLIVIILDNVLIWHTNKAVTRHTSVSQSDEA